MPKFVALDWDDRQVRLIFANQQGTSFTVEDAVTIALDPAEADQPSSQLSELIGRAVSDHRYRSAEAVVTIRRADVELRLLTLPRVPADELSEIVRFQALKEFSEISEDWPVDYLQVDTTSNDEMTVMAAAVSTQRVQEFRTIATASELRPYSLVLRPCAAASLVHHQTDHDGEPVQLMVDDFGAAIELTVLKGHAATFIRTVQNPASSHRLEHLAGEIRRTMVAAQNQLGGERVQQVILFGSGTEHQAFCQQLEERLRLPVNPVDPFKGLQLGRRLQGRLPDSPERFAAALGLLVNQVDSQSPVLDFFNPRRAPAPKSKRPLMIGLSSAAAVVLALLVVVGWWYLKSLDNAILAKQRQIQSQRSQVEAAQRKIDAHESVKAWLQADINWLDELRNVSQKLPPAERARLREFRVGVFSTGNGYLSLEGVADEHGTIPELERNLRDPTHRVRGEGGLYERQVEDLPWRFKEMIVIETDPSGTQPSSDPRADRGSSIPGAARIRRGAP